MDSSKRSALADKTGLLIIGGGASLLYYYFERTLQGSNLTIIITIAVILLISCCTQVLVNNINSSKRALQEMNQTLEQRVRERTEELRSSELKYRTIFENTGAATIIIEKDFRISCQLPIPGHVRLRPQGNSEPQILAGFHRREESTQNTG